MIQGWGSHWQASTKVGQKLLICATVLGHNTTSWYPTLACPSSTTSLMSLLNAHGAEEVDEASRGYVLNPYRDFTSISHRLAALENVFGTPSLGPSSVVPLANSSIVCTRSHRVKLLMLQL